MQKLLLAVLLAVSLSAGSALVFSPRRGSLSALALHGDRIDELVERLGRPHGPANNDLIAELHRTPRRSVARLAREVRAIGRDTVEAWHVIWCLRALYSITGEEFRFRTRYRLSREQLVCVRQADPLGYYWVWVTRGRVFLAPVDVQEKVARAWREWVDGNQESFVPRREPTVFTAL